LVFQRSGEPQAQAIQVATGSEFTHCGIVYVENGRPYVLEAVQPVSRTTLHAWQQRCLGNSFRVKRLQPGKNVDANALIRYFSSVEGRNYDGRFAWDDAEIYCSELVWKAYQACGIELCKPRPFSSYQLHHPTVQALIRERYTDWDFNPDMRAVSPQDLWESPLLVPVPLKRAGG
jgi:hypothetical protein